MLQRYTKIEQYREQMHKQSSTTLLIIFLLLSSSLYSSTDTVFAFAHTITNIHPYKKRQPLYQRQYIMQTRGGSTATRQATTKLSTSTSNDKDDKTIKSAKQALSAIQYCVKMSFFSVLSNVVSKLSSSS